MNAEVNETQNSLTLGSQQCPQTGTFRIMFRNLKQNVEILFFCGGKVTYYERGRDLIANNAREMTSSQAYVLLRK